MHRTKIFIIGTRGFPNVQGGVEKHCEELYPRLIKFGCDVTVITRTPYIPKEKQISEWKGVKFIHLWAPRKKNFEAVVHTLIASLVCIFEGPEIAHFHNIGPGLFIPLLRLARIRTVLTYHSINYEHQKWGKLAKFVLRLGEFLGLKFADKVIVISRATKEFSEKKYGRKDLEFISNGVNLSEIIPAGNTLKKYNLEPMKYVFTACRFVPEKGLHDLIAAYKRVENPEFKLVIVGDADYETEYSKNIKKSVKGNERIILTGFISGRPLQELYSNAGLFVLPSYYEGLPMALLEAMSYSLPVLVSDIPQNRGISLPQFRFFKPGDINALMKKIVELFKVGIGENEKIKQREILQQNHNWDKIAQQTFEVYRSIVNLSLN